MYANFRRQQACAEPPLNAGTPTTAYVSSSHMAVAVATRITSRPRRNAKLHAGDETRPKQSHELVVIMYRK